MVEDTPKTETFLDKLRAGLNLALQGTHLPQKPVRLLVALSGGADSTALLLGLKELSKQEELELAVCHVNHGLRGKESDADQSFCQDLCKKLGVPVTVKAISSEAITPASQSEERLREMRYALLREAASGHDNARRLANKLLRLHQTDPVTGLLLDGWRTKHLHLLRYKAGVNKRTLRLGLGWSFTGSLFTGWPAATIAMYSRISIFQH